MATIVDWTVDKLLSSVQSINTQAAQLDARIKADRARYMATLRSLPQVQDVASRERLRGQLGEWIKKQVDVENRMNGFLAMWASAKAQAAKFLNAAHIQVPTYLGAVPLVPAAIVGVIVVAVAVMAVVAAQNNLQGKALDGLSSLVNNAAAQGWTEAQTANAVDAYARAVAAASKDTKPSPDPLGLTGALKAALPVVVGIAAIMLLPRVLDSLKSLKPRRAAGYLR